MHLFIFFQNEIFFFFRVPDSVYTRTISKAVRGLVVSSEDTLQKELAFCCSSDGLL